MSKPSIIVHPRAEAPQPHSAAHDHGVRQYIVVAADQLINPAIAVHQSDLISGQVLAKLGPRPSVAKVAVPANTT